MAFHMTDYERVLENCCNMAFENEIGIDDVARRVFCERYIQSALAHNMPLDHITYAFSSLLVKGVTKYSNETMEANIRGYQKGHRSHHGHDPITCPVDCMETVQKQVDMLTGQVKEITVSESNIKTTTSDLMNLMAKIVGYVEGSDDV